MLYPPLAFQLYRLLVAIVLAPGVVAAEQHHEPLEVEVSFWARDLLQALHLMPLKQWETITVRLFHVHHPLFA